MAGSLKIPYALTPAVALDQRYAHMRSAIARDIPRLQRQPIDDEKTLSVACFGPSLRDTWQDLRHPIISMSGATKFLVEHGITPDYHIDMDPRAHKVMTSLPPVPGVTYLVASVCCPEYFDALQDHLVLLWHTVSSNWNQDLDWVSQHDRGELVVSTGSTIGLGAIQLGGILGFRRFEIHGMDGSFQGDNRHAGHHAGKPQKPNITWDAGGVTYRTSRIMANAVAEAVNTVRGYPIICVFHGEGLTQALIREANVPNACCADETEKRAKLTTRRPTVVHLPPLVKGRLNVWESLLGSLERTDLPDLINQIPICEARRGKAAFNTGSVPFETSVFLRAICRFYRPQVIAEIGTFIGTSTHALMASRVIYTCDHSNDCLPASDTIVTHPLTSSTNMLAEIQEPVDLFFFDGRIQPDDVAHLRRLSHPGTIYVFDDCVEKRKGLANMQIILKEIAPNALMILPYEPFLPRGSSLGIIVPTGVS